MYSIDDDQGIGDLHPFEEVLGCIITEKHDGGSDELIDLTGGEADVAGSDFLVQGIVAEIQENHGTTVGNNLPIKEINRRNDGASRRLKTMGNDGDVGKKEGRKRSKYYIVAEKQCGDDVLGKKADKKRKLELNNKKGKKEMVGEANVYRERCSWGTYGQCYVQARDEADFRHHMVIEWKSQFGKMERYYHGPLEQLMYTQTDGGFWFKINFLVLYLTSIGESNKNAICNSRFLQCINDEAAIHKFDCRRLDLEKILLPNISSLIKADLVYVCTNNFAEKLGRTREDIEDELLKGLLTNLRNLVSAQLVSACRSRISLYQLEMDVQTKSY
nr:peptidase C48, SUMO/sentrin/Ubl1 [Tanacetum cinerariifolium]